VIAMVQLLANGRRMSRAQVITPLYRLNAGASLFLCQTEHMKEQARLSTS
jgi:hypothetical protein